LTDPAGRPGRPGRWSLVLAVIGYVTGLLMATLAASVWISVHHGQTNGLGTVASSEIGLWIGLGGAALYASRSEGSASLARDFGLRFAWVDPILGGPVGVAAQYLLGFVVVLAYQASGVSNNTINKLGQPAQTITGLAHGWGGDVVLILVVVVGAPVVEELFFRGLLLRSLQARIGSVGAVLVSGVLFGLAHFEPLQLPVLALFGVVLGVLALRTGRLGPGICAHAAFNSLAVYTLLSSR